MKTAFITTNLVALLCALALGVTGCSLLRPSGTTPRSFVLTAAATAAATPVGTAPAIGIAPVKIPGYLFTKQMAVRRATNEVAYFDSAQWAERLDAGLQRVLAANLGVLLNTDEVRLSTWRPNEISAAIYINVERFDVDAAGEARLVAWWRIQSSDGKQPPKSGRFSSSRHGAPPETNPAAAVAAMNHLATEFAEQLAKAIQGHGS